MFQESQKSRISSEMCKDYGFAHGGRQWWNRLKDFAPSGQKQVMNKEFGREHQLIEHTLLISEASREIADLPDHFTEELAATIVTRDGKKVMAILPYHVYKALLDTMESLQETLEIMQDPEMMAALREGIQAIERGETVAWEDVKEELDSMVKEGR